MLKVFFLNKIYTTYKALLECSQEVSDKHAENPRLVISLFISLYLTHPLAVQDMNVAAHYLRVMLTDPRGAGGYLTVDKEPYIARVLWYLLQPSRREIEDELLSLT